LAKDNFQDSIYARAPEAFQKWGPVLYLSTLSQHSLLLFPFFPFLFFPFSLMGPPHHTLNQLRGLRGLESAVSSTCGVWGVSPADKRFDAHLSQKERLWWQQLL